MDKYAVEPPEIEKDFRQQIIDIIGLDLGDGIDKLIALFKEWHNKLSVPIEVDRGVEKAAEEWKKQFRTNIINSWSFLRNENHDIPDDVIDFMKDAALEKLAGAKWAGNDAVEFAEWLLANTSMSTKNEFYVYAGQNFWTTGELYNLFKQQK